MIVAKGDVRPCPGDDLSKNANPAVPLSGTRSDEAHKFLA
jgi:hypothetical protein